MLSVTAIADQYAWLYQTKLSEPPGTWDHVIPVDGAYTSIKRIDGIDYVMFRGSTTFMDWVEDFRHVAVPDQDDQLGPVHPGARRAILAIKDQIDELVGENVVAVGHSLGALHAALYSGYRVAAGKPLAGLVMFGEPRSGGPKLSRILKDTPIQSFRNADKNGHDAVCDVPFKLDDSEFPYQHVRDPLTDCWHSPREDDLWGPFRYHHFGHYARAFGCGAPQALSLPI